MKNVAHGQECEVRKRRTSFRQMTLRILRELWNEKHAMAFRDLQEAADTNSSILNNRPIGLREAATIERVSAAASRSSPLACHGPILALASGRLMRSDQIFEFVRSG
jgi:hypothetical protein